MRLPSDRLESLASPAFIAALALLVVNDVVLKPLFHNAVTGKLSDFAGLFALTLFVATLCPQHRRVGAWTIAAAFTFWKTSYADPLIAWLNALSPFTLGRTVDLTDLAALPMIAVAVWAAARLRPWPLPRALQVSVALLAPVAFTATSRLPYAVRSSLDVSSAALVDAAALQSFVDEVADQHGLRCLTCDPLAEGRAYLHDGRSSSKGPGTLTVNFDEERRVLFFATTGWQRDGRRGVLALSEDIRAGLQERFPGVTAIEFAETRESSPSQDGTVFTIQLPAGDRLSVETVEEAKRTLSSIVEEVVRAHGLLTDATALVYYAGRRVGIQAQDRDLVLMPTLETNATLHVRVARHTKGFEVLQQAVTEDLAVRLDAAFGSAVTRQDFGMN